MKTLCANIFLLLLTATVIVHSKQYIASEVLYNKLEDALFSSKSVLYMMQEVFIPSKLLSRNLVYLYVCVTIGGVQPGSCDSCSPSCGQSNYSYCQRFQWSSSALVDLISVADNGCHDRHCLTPC